MIRKVLKFLALIPNSTYRHGLLSGVAAAIEHDKFLCNCSFATILDAGANNGQFALTARAHYPNARIISFEPLEGPAAKWRRIFDGDHRASLWSMALGSTPGTQRIHLSRRNDSSSLLPIGELQSKIFPGTEEVGVEDIRVTTLDIALANEVIESPILLKIDVQGFEMSLLEGSLVTLKKVDDIYIELSFVPLYIGQALAGEVTIWLSQFGFRLSGVFNIAFSKHGVPVQADFHFQKHKPA